MEGQDNTRAFPQSIPICEEDQGMTLRDYFAAKAMQAQISSASVDIQWDRGYDEIARCAYAQADEMLKARNK